ncbi:MAG TPA: hypothetical protein VKY92_10490 [Verrucomicrobiae bacterium]|nr:hypothetical protein [Verrucomicrobiae bacterium]
MTALAKLYAATGDAKVLQLQDELLRIGYRPLMISVGLLEIVVALFLCKSRSDLKRCLALLWLSGNFLLYHFGDYILGVHLCPCLGHLTDRLPLPKGLAEVLFQFLALYWFLASLNMLWREWGSVQWARLLQFRNRLFRRTSARPV